MLQQLDTAIAFAVVMLMLSLLITVVVQVFNSIFDMRGRSLAWGLTKLLHQIDPALREPSARKWYTFPATLGRRIAKAVALHPAIAHGVRRAKAIRPEELIAILQDLASPKPRVKLESDVETAVKNLILARVPGGSGDLSKAHQIAADLAVQFPKLDDAIKDALGKVVGTTSKLEHQVDAWFSTVMDRASEVFAAQSRVVTFVFAAILAVTLHIDSGAILKQISSSAEVRANLVRVADSTVAEADRVLDRDKRASKALKAMADSHKGDAAGAALSKAPDNLARCPEGRAWLSSDPGVKSLNAPALRDEFDNACDQQTRAVLADTGKEVEAIRNRLDETELHFVPTKVGNIMVFASPPGTWWQAYTSWHTNGVPKHLLGTLATVLLLSLGAPFWYNALRQLASLKPAIARRIDKEQAPAPEESAETQSGKQR